MSGHSQNSPSSFKRRRACPGSRALEAMYPDEDSPFAKTGTAVHAVCEQCLTMQREPEEFFGETVEDVVIDEDMIAGAKVYVDYCNELIAKADDYMVEEKLDLPFLGEDEKGTADFIALHGSVLEVVDYKNGVVYVDADDNEQGICYGLGAAKRYHNREWDTLRITIAQPNAIGKEDIRSWDLPRSEIMDYMFEFNEAAERTFDEDAPLIAGPHCKFCKAAVDCIALRQYSLFDAQESFGVVDDLDADALADALNRIPATKQLIAAIEDKALSAAQAGNPPTGYKLVASRATRYWKDEADAVKRLKDYGLDDKDLYKRDFKSPAQIEKVVGKKPFEADLADDLVEKRSTGVSLATLDDPRPPVRPSASETFETV